jgi:uncharacterized protein (TIGR01777 family)
MAIILITGGTGLVGKALGKRLLEQGHEVRIMSRMPHSGFPAASFYWNIEKQEMDEAALDGVEHIVHLAGSGVADKRWTERRKKEIISSRVDSMKLIAAVVKKKNIRLKSFVGASAIGIYGMITSEKIYTENDAPGQDFLSEVCVAWEDSYKEIKEFSERTNILRIGVVLSEKGGALKRLLPLFKLGLGSAVGSGKQYMPWIHLDDLVSIICETLFNPLFNGIYNAVAPEHQSSNRFSAQFAKSLNRPFFVPNVPAFLLKLLFGQMANVLLEGSRVSNEKLLKTGFVFKYPNVEATLNEIATQKVLNNI